MRLTCLEDRMRPAMQTIGRVRMEPRCRIASRHDLLGSGDLWEIYVSSETPMIAGRDPVNTEQLVLLAVHDAFGAAVLTDTSRGIVSSTTARAVNELTKGLFGQPADLVRLSRDLMYATQDNRFATLMRVSDELRGDIMAYDSIPF